MSYSCSDFSHSSYVQLYGRLCFLFLQTLLSSFSSFLLLMMVVMMPLFLAFVLITFFGFCFLSFLRSCFFRILFRPFLRLLLFLLGLDVCYAWFVSGFYLKKAWIFGYFVNFHFGRVLVILMNFHLGLASF